MSSPTERFSTRVENYVKYRPSYPAEVLSLLKVECGLTPHHVVTDVGSGTGILTRILLDNGNLVYAVEPNAEMRGAAERLLAGYPNFRSVAATAEDTTLPAGSIDLVTAGQAFHWFRAEEARREFARILKPGGWVALVWNSRRDATTPFLADYERLLREYAGEYETVKHRRVADTGIEQLFEGGSYRVATFENSQHFDYEGLKGRALSSSYVPMAGQPGHNEMMEELRRIFERHHVGGQVSFDYDTHVYYGHLAP